MSHHVDQTLVSGFAVEPVTRRAFAGQLAGAGVAFGWAPGQESSTLFGLCREPLKVEILGQPAQLLEPGPARPSFESTVADFPKTGPLAIRQIVRVLAGGLVERSLEVQAQADAIFNLELSYRTPRASAFYSWHKQETATIPYVQDVDQKGKWQGGLQLFPFAGAVEGTQLTGALGDCPGFWENNAQQVIDPEARRIALRTGDGSPAHRISTIAGDGSGLYHGEVDGWQHIRAGQIRRFRTWLFSARVDSLYGVQMAAHRALSKALRPRDSDLTAILRNTAYLLVRRNLLRTESRFIIISGMNYGWKEWVSDMAMAGLGLEDPEVLTEAVRGIFWKRCNYEDNAQWYLIISALIAAAGYQPDLATCRLCLEFMRDNQKDGAYIPPGGLWNAEVPLGGKTYMDLFCYAEGDCPTSNQGFHCGALMAGQQLGFGVTEADIARACSAYAATFNREGGYFPTSTMRPEVFGGDALYGEAVAFAAFGRKSLPDPLVLRHCRHAMKIQSRYGIRVVSKANGDLLEANQYGPNSPYGLAPDRAGGYVQGGSWFFCDAGTWLSGLAHGLEPRQVDALLIERIKEELAHLPAFSESINTRTCEPHGNILYSANSLYVWLRPAIRRRLKLTGPDPVDTAIGAYLENRLRAPAAR